MLLNVVMYLALRHEYMRNKRFEKILERRKKAQEEAQEKIEQLELEAIYYKDGVIDWYKLAKHVSEATSGRQQS